MKSSACVGCPRSPLLTLVHRHFAGVDRVLLFVERFCLKRVGFLPCRVFIS